MRPPGSLKKLSRDPGDLMRTVTLAIPANEKCENFQALPFLEYFSNPKPTLFLLLSLKFASSFSSQSYDGENNQLACLELQLVVPGHHLIYPAKTLRYNVSMFHAPGVEFESSGDHMRTTRSPRSLESLARKLGDFNDPGDLGDYMRARLKLHSFKMSSV